MAAIRDSHLECGNRYLAAHEGAFHRAKQRGYLPPSVDPRCAAVGLMALADGLIVNWVLDRELFPLASYGPIVVDAYLDGLCIVKKP
jgi:TetR/AcrR family transcriptional regulator, acrAB operon repressor